MADAGGEKALAQVICVEQAGSLRPFVSLDDLERLAADDVAFLKSIEAAHIVFESIKERPGVTYVLVDRRLEPLLNSRKASAHAGSGWIELVNQHPVVGAVVERLVLLPRVRAHGSFAFEARALQ